MNKIYGLILMFMLVTTIYAIPAEQDTSNIVYYANKATRITGDTFMSNWNKYMMDDAYEWETENDYFTRITTNSPNNMFYWSCFVDDEEDYYPYPYREYDADSEIMSVRLQSVVLWESQRFFIIPIKHTEIKKGVYPAYDFSDKKVNIQKMEERFYCFLPMSILGQYDFYLPKSEVKNCNLKMGFIGKMYFKSQLFNNYFEPTYDFLFDISRKNYLINMRVGMVFLFNGNTGKIYNKKIIY